MKLRIKGDSVRLRLSQEEVARLAADGAVEESTRLAPGQALAYRLETRGTETRAALSGGVLVVSVPAEAARAWAKSDQVGIEARVDTGEGRVLQVLVEKDFQCLHKRPGEDEGGNFPNPAAQ